ncbi:MAG: ATP synthase F0 subunit B [Desulfobacterales bacterium]
MQIISNTALITINETLFVQLVSFLIFVFVINRVMFRPLKSSMDEREAYISGLDQDIEDTQKNMETMLKELKKKEKTARFDAHEIRMSLEDEGNRKAVELHDELMKNISDLRQKTEAEVERQIAEARKHLQRESEVLAVTVMEKVLNRRLAA